VAPEIRSGLLPGLDANAAAHLSRRAIAIAKMDASEAAGQSRLIRGFREGANSS
jgi:hypothetical protein